MRFFIVGALAACAACLLDARNLPPLIAVNDPGNPGENLPFHGVGKPYPRGRVDYPYRIGKAEVSNAEYAEFLNACAAAEDPFRLWDERMKITRQGGAGAYRYAAVPGWERAGVAWVSRVNAARYCNFLTSGSPDRGAYRIEPRRRPSGKVYDAIVGYRDLTFPDAPRVCYLPDMHEFYKAGWYDGRGKYRKLTAADRDRPSFYGLEKFASGLREHVEDRVHAGTPFVLGADDKTVDEAGLNTARLWPQPEYEGRADTGFRIAATAPLQIGRRLNHRNNFFFDRQEHARLRIRNDAPLRRIGFQLELQDFSGKTVWKKRIVPELKRGVTVLPVELPGSDGYYELLVTPEEASFAGTAVRIPLAVMYAAVDNGREGRFGLTCHVARREQLFDFEAFDFDLLRKLGASQIRVDVNFSDRGSSLEVVQRIRRAGMNPLAVLPGAGMNNYGRMTQLRLAHPELVEKWEKHGVAPEFAWYAEQINNLTLACRGIVRDWEICNEPTFWKILPEDYVQLLKSCYKAMKLADPAVNVMAGDLSALHPVLFGMGGGDFCDSLAIHIYGFYVPKFWGFAGKMRELNGWKNAAGVPGKPVWLTETGCCNYSSAHLIPVRTLDEVRRYQALSMPKIMAGNLAFGAEKVLPYNFRDLPLNNLEEEFGMIDRFGFPKPAAASFRTCAGLLGRATFRGFIAGHSFEKGKIVGLAFRDDRGRDVLLFWRNDSYSHDDFRSPFREIIHPADTITIEAAGDRVELYNLSGGSRSIAVKDAVVKIPVDEYPVFVRGRLSPQLAEVSTAHAVPLLRLSKAEVRIMPSRPERACDLMSSKLLEMRAGTLENVAVRVYNLSGETLEGTLRLTPRKRWNEWEWPVKPEVAALRIPANGMATGNFQVEIPESGLGERLFYLDAVLTDAAGGSWRDSVVFRVVPQSFDVRDWTTYSRGCRLSQENSTEIRLSWGEQRPAYVGFTARNSGIFAEDKQMLEGELSLPVNPGGARISAVSLLFRDAGGNTFQLKQPVRLPEGRWSKVRFRPEEILGKGVIVYHPEKGGVQWPVTLHGFNFDFDSRGTAGPGAILLKNYERNLRYTGNLSGGGGSVGMD